MADEEKTEATQSETGAETAGAGKESEQKEGQGKTEDYEAMYKAEQAARQKAIEERDEARNTLDTVYPAIDFAKLQGGGSEEGDYSEEPKTATVNDLQLVESRIDNKLLTLDFRQKHPELREYETTLVGPAIARIRSRNPRMPVDKVLEKAAEETSQILESEREKGRQEAAKKKAEAAAASGLGSAASSSTAKESGESEGESHEDYIARRQKESAKARGLI